MKQSFTKKALYNVYIYIQQNKIQISKERTMKCKPQNSLWSLSGAYHQWRVQMTFLVTVSMKTKYTDMCPKLLKRIVKPSKIPNKIQIT